MSSSEMTLAIVGLVLTVILNVILVFYNAGRLTARMDAVEKRLDDTTQYSAIDQRLQRIENFMDQWLSHVSSPRLNGHREYDKLGRGD